MLPSRKQHTEKRAEHVNVFTDDKWTEHGTFLRRLGYDDTTQQSRNRAVWKMRSLTAWLVLVFKAPLKSIVHTNFVTVARIRKEARSSASYMHQKRRGRERTLFTTERFARVCHILFIMLCARLHGSRISITSIVSSQGASASSPISMKKTPTAHLDGSREENRAGCFRFSCVGDHPHLRHSCPSGGRCL